MFEATVVEKIKNHISCQITLLPNFVPFMW